MSHFTKASHAIKVKKNQINRAKREIRCLKKDIKNDAKKTEVINELIIKAQSGIKELYRIISKIRKKRSKATIYRKFFFYDF